MSMGKLMAWDTETYRKLRDELDRTNRFAPTITMYKCPVCGKGILLGKPFGDKKEELSRIKGNRTFSCSHCGKEIEARETKLMTVGPENVWGYSANINGEEKVFEVCSNEEFTEFAEEFYDGMTKEDRDKKKEVDYHKWVAENGDFILRFLEENGFVKRNKDVFGSLPMF